MARLRRIVLPGQAHLIIQRGHNGQRVFVDEPTGKRYLASLREAAREARVAIHAYGLLGTEVRLLATPSDAAGLARMMQSIGRRFVRLFNRRHGRSGTPWEGRFRSAAIEARAHFLDCLRFVEEAGGGAPARGPGAEGVRSSAAHHLAGRVDAARPGPPGLLGPGQHAVRARGRLPAARIASPSPRRGWPRSACGDARVGARIDAFAAQAADQAQRQARPASAGPPSQKLRAD